MIPESIFEIMVVDDVSANVQLLQRVLERRGYGVRTFLRGADAVLSAREAPPDLILLDINMPEMNGYETCKLLKQDQALAAVPVIFLSGITETEGKMEAFRCGGVDYISKPFELEEVNARVDTHLKLASLQKRLRDHNLQLEAMVAARTCELAQAHAQLARLDQAKSEFLQMISHELRTPLNGLLGAAELILCEAEGAEHAVELSNMLCESRQRVLSLVEGALLLTQVEVEGGEFPCEEVRLGEVLANAAERARPLAKERGVRIQLPWGDVGPTTGNRELLARAWQGLLETAVRFCSAGDSVMVLAEPASDILELAIETPAGAIPAASLPKFFHLFGISEASTAAGHLGLDPAMAKRILYLWGSSVEVANRELGGIRISVHCPRAVQFNDASLRAMVS